MRSNRLQTLLCLALGALMLLPGTIEAAPAKKKADNKKYAKSNLDLYQLHHLNMWGGAGYSGLVNSYTNNSFIGGGGGLIGVGYEWHYKNFMLGLGPEFRLFTSADHYTFPNRWDVDISRTEIQAGMPVQVDEVKHFDLHNFRENNVVGQVMLPIVAGAQFPDAQVPMFFLAGVKVGYTLFSNYSQKGDLTTSVTDRIAMDNWFDMPEHDVQTVPYAAKGAIHPGLDVALTAEAGVLLENFFSEEWKAANAERKYPWHMRVSLFIDYGLPILHNGGSAPVVSVTPDPADASKALFATNSIHGSDASTSGLNSLMVGVKFAAQLQLNHTKQKKPLNPYIGVRVEDNRTGELITPDGLRLTVQPVGTKRAPRPLKAQPRGALHVSTRLAPGDYVLDIAKAGYLPHEPVQVEVVPGRNLNVKALEDTTVIRLSSSAMCVTARPASPSWLPCRWSIRPTTSPSPNCAPALHRDMPKATCPSEVYTAHSSKRLTTTRRYSLSACRDWTTSSAPSSSTPSKKARPTSSRTSSSPPTRHVSCLSLRRRCRNSMSS